MPDRYMRRLKLESIVLVFLGVPLLFTGMYQGDATMIITGFIATLHGSKACDTYTLMELIKNENI